MSVDPSAQGVECMLRFPKTEVRKPSGQVALRIRLIKEQKCVQLSKSVSASRAQDELDAMVRTLHVHSEEPMKKSTCASPAQALPLHRHCH